MPLEDLGGNKYINNLQEQWPLGTDLVNAGDDHIRGVKNVLKKTFPNLTGPVTRTQDSLNNGSVPVNSLITFYAATAPVGWVRQDVNNIFMMRIIPTTGDQSELGGTGGGTHDPTFNDVVPEHDHLVFGYTEYASNPHTHHVEFNTSAEGSVHTHNFSANTEISRGLYASGANVYFGAAQDGVFTITTSGVTGGENESHIHAAIGDTGPESDNHTHVISFRSEKMILLMYGARII